MSHSQLEARTAIDERETTLALAADRGEAFGEALAGLRHHRIRGIEDRLHRHRCKDVLQSVVQRDHPAIRSQPDWVQAMPSRRTTSARNSRNSGPRSSRRNASSTVARR